MKFSPVTYVLIFQEEYEQGVSFVKHLYEQFHVI